VEPASCEPFSIHRVEDVRRDARDGAKRAQAACRRHVMSDASRQAAFEQAFATTDTGLDAVKRDLARSMIQAMGRDPAFASTQDWFFALAYFLRGRLSASRLRTWRRNFSQDAKWVYYLSLEFLPGRLLKSCLKKQGLLQVCRQALADFGVDLDVLYECEVEAALGNGGLGRLAACLLDSMATLHYAGIGYGIRYEYGMFRQKIENGEQVEHPENWLKNANPWEFGRPNVIYPVRFNGRVMQVSNWHGELICHWVDADDIMAMGYDIPVIGFGNDTVSSIRLWSAKATTDFNLTYFNRGNYIEAVQEKSESETLSKVLYPTATTDMGRELRLKQEYFLVSASIQDILSRFRKKHGSLELLPERVAIQLNDTHPALAIPELMRILVDEFRMGWERSWDITVRTIGFTNHTLLSEALEHWSVDLLGALLPRHLQIIYEINHRLLRDVTHRHPGDFDRLRRMSLIDENPPRSVRMANLAIVGSHRVNGVSEMHTGIMRTSIFRDFDEFFPGRIVNLTNGIDHRRWLAETNPDLAALISSRISDGWEHDLDRIADLAPHAEDPEFRSEFRAIKRAAKERLASLFEQRLGLRVTPESMFDVQIKRIHEYKRQLLNVLHIVTRYNRIRHGLHGDMAPRTVILSGKAAPGYAMAKLIVRLINCVADIVNNDPAVHSLLRVVFVPNYDVQTAQDIMPAADLSQQISLAGTEASGTGNMKLALNGALTIATRDGANNEIARAVGEDNIFLFGLSYEEVGQLRASGNYDPRRFYHANPELRETLDMIREGYFCPDRQQLFAPIVESLLDHGDHYMLLADYAAYVATQDRVDAAYMNPDEWARKAVVNIAHMGRFSTDRLVREYADTVWNAEPVRETRGGPAQQVRSEVAS
jgi:starch phosphorylase